MKKQTKVLVAATLLTLGASFSSLAALKNGTWVNGEDGWQYFDKEGEVVESEWCLSNGIEYWINDEGYLGADEWVTEGDYSFYVQSDGSKALNTWKYIYGEDDEDADEESWFYFDAKGRMIDGDYEKIGGKTYYFDENGKMLTGWVDTKNFINANEDSKGKTDIADVVFCDENGARVNKAWINEFPWDADLDECYEGEHEEWFYADGDGKLYKTKKTIDGYTYFFNHTTREMLEGWIIYDGTNYIAAEDDKTFTEQNAVDVYFATEDGAGYAKKNGWRELENPNGDEYWYYFDKLGKVFLGTATESNATIMNFADGEELYADAVKEDTVVGNVESRKIDGVKYYFNADGEMLDGLVTIDNALMYLNGGAAQTGKVTLTDDNENDYTFYFADKTEDDYKKYVAVNGNKDGYCYVGGLLVKAEESGIYRIVELDNGAKFVVDYRGKIQHNSSKKYECEDGKTYQGTYNEKTDGLLEDSVDTLTEVK